jgi:hypothetical protein
MLQHQLETAAQNTGIKMRLSIWGEGRRSYQLIAESDGTELSHVMDRTNCHLNLNPSSPPLDHVVVVV